MKKKIFRIIDANINRSREGLRVCEEIARFALGSRALTGQIKSVRDAVSLAARRFERKLGGHGALACARDAEEDVGRASRIPGGITRRNLRDIFAANMERAKESLRVLEEFFKLVDPAWAMKFSRLRFKAYEIEKKAVLRIEALRHRR